MLYQTKMNAKMKQTSRGGLDWGRLKTRKNINRKFL